MEHREGTGMKKEWHYREKSKCQLSYVGFQVLNLLNRINCNEKIDVTVQVDS